MRLAIFDVDGTLSDSAAMIIASLTATYESEGLVPPDRKTLLSGIGMSLERLMEHLRPGDPTERHARMAKAYREAFWGFRQRGEHPEHLFDGAKPLLVKLRAEGVALGIATGKARRGVDYLLDKNGMTGWFATIQTPDTNPSKPHPAMIHAAITETGVSPAAAIMVGDATFDIEMARAAEAGAIGVTWGNHDRADLERTGAHVIVSDFNGLELALETLWQERGA